MTRLAARTVHVRNAVRGRTYRVTLPVEIVGDYEYDADGYPGFMTLPGWSRNVKLPGDAVLTDDTVAPVKGAFARSRGGGRIHRCGHDGFAICNEPLCDDVDADMCPWCFPEADPGEIRRGAAGFGGG